MKKIQIQSLAEDIQATNALNKFHANSGFARARNPLPWWKAVMVAGTYFEGNFTLNDARCILALVDFHIPATGATLLKNAVEGKRPSPCSREYTKTLPKIARSLGLNFVKTPATSSGRGRSASLFKFKSPENARNLIEAQFPETKGLFEILDQAWPN